MDGAIKVLYKTIMALVSGGHFRGLEFTSWNNLPRCQAELVGVRFEMYAVNYAHRGRVRWVMGDGRVREVRGPVAWWMVPGHGYTFGRYAGESWDHSWAGFTGPRVMEWERGGLVPRLEGGEGGAWEGDDWFVPIGRSRWFRGEFGRLLRLLDSATPGAVSRAVHVLEGMLLEMYGRGEGGEQGVLRAEPMSGRDRRIRDVAEACWKREEGGRGGAGGVGGGMAVTEMARRAGLSGPQFRREFRRVMGVSPRRYATDCKLSAAADLLRRQHESIKQVADEAGFSSVYYFSRCFREKFGVSPTRFRGDARLGEG